MPEQFALASQLKIEINGTEVNSQVMGNVLSVDVEQHVHLPDMFTVRLQDPEFQLIDEGPFDLTKEIEISAAKQDGTWITLIKGEITALEPEFQEGMIARLVARGYDKSHRLYRETKSRAHLNKKDSDLASEIAQAINLAPDVEPTSTVYDHIFQHNQSDLAFLQERAWRIGYECFVEEGKLVFRKPPAQGNGVTLTWGQELLSFYPRMNLAEQVDEVVVRGWDAGRQTPIVGRARRGNLYPDIEESKDGAGWAKSFGEGKRIYVEQNVLSQAEANMLAGARLDEISGAFVQADGEALRRPDIRAGRAVKLEALGERFSGTYLVTTARHTYTSGGFRTTFSVRGTRTGLITEELGVPVHQPRYLGVVPAVVTNTDDPNNWGRVKVKFPWMTEDAESDWARVAGIGAGPEAGIMAIPEIDDEVLVAFEQGDFRRPYVLGSLWNGQHQMPSESSPTSGERPLVRSWRSRTGHRITMYDNADNKIEILTNGGHTIVMDDANRQIKITSSGGIVFNLDDSGGKLTVESTEIQIKASGNVKIESGANMDLQAGGQVNIKGALINLN